ncbi:MAG: helix-turn-helix domain-containing protein [Maribacter sp.]|nr:helix-turn-helix domain-containing protein [Maribacter sp.]
MANTLDPMDLKQIITLHKDGFSNRAIGATLDISRNTVNNYMKLIKGCGYSFEKLLTFDHVTLYKLFPYYTTIDTDRQDELMLYFETINRARNHPGFTFLHHYQANCHLSY